MQRQAVNIPQYLHQLLTVDWMVINPVPQIVGLKVIENLHNALSLEVAEQRKKVV